MRKIALVLVAAALPGCAVYPAYGPPGGGVYVAPAPVVVYPSYGYAYGPRYGGPFRGGGYGYRGWRR